MSERDRLREEINSLSREKAKLCDQATSNVQKQISELTEKLKNFEVTRAKENRAKYLELADVVAEISRVSFLLYVFGGYDNRFRVTHHVSWLEVRDRNSSDEFESFHCHYANKESGSVLVQHAQDLLKEVKSQYHTFVGEAVE